jgi:hypothetical protein
MNTLPVTPAGLIEVLKTKKCFAFVGAGISASSGYPSWKDLLLTLIEVGIKDYGFKTAHAAELKSLLDQDSKFLVVAQELSDLFNRPILVEEIAKYFKGIVEHPSPVLDSLTKLPFKGVITTNYDQLLENAYAVRLRKIPPYYTYKDAANFADALWSGDFFILKAHGDIVRKETIILTERDYRSIIYSHPGYRTMFSSIVTTHSLFFVGVSLNDPETQMLLAHMHHAFDGGGPTHYALVPSETFNETLVSRWRKDFRVQCICYNPSAGHPEVNGFLTRLATEITA